MERAAAEAPQPDNTAQGNSTQADQQPDPAQKDAHGLTKCAEQFEKARRAISNYDVYLTVAVTLPMKSVIVDKKDPA